MKLRLLSLLTLGFLLACTSSFAAEAYTNVIDLKGTGQPLPGSDSAMATTPIEPVKPQSNDPLTIFREQSCRAWIRCRAEPS